MKFHFTDLGNFFEVTKIVTLFDVNITPALCMEKVRYDFWGVLYVESGSLNVEVGDSVFNLVQNQLIFYPPDHTHKFVESNSPTCKVWTIRFVSYSPLMNYFKNKVYTLKSREIAAMSKITSIGSKIFRWFGNDSNEHGMYAIESCSPLELYGLKLQLETLFFTLYTEYDKVTNSKKSKKTRRNRDFVLEIADYMQKNLSENFSVEEIARKFCVGESTLKRVFKEETGQGVLNYFIDLKIKKSLEYMSINEMNFSEISYALGFSSSFYFSRVFKKKMGMTPTEYRNQMQE